MTLHRTVYRLTLIVIAVSWLAGFVLLFEFAANLMLGKSFNILIPVLIFWVAFVLRWAFQIWLKRLGNVPEELDSK